MCGFDWKKKYFLNKIFKIFIVERLELEYIRLLNNVKKSNKGLFESI